VAGAEVVVCAGVVETGARFAEAGSDEESVAAGWLLLLSAAF
jgi:hypothetical protein